MNFMKIHVYCAVYTTTQLVGLIKISREKQISGYAVEVLYVVG